MLAMSSVLLVMKKNASKNDERKIRNQNNIEEVFKFDKTKQNTRLSGRFWAHSPVFFQDMGKFLVFCGLTKTLLIEMKGLKNFFDLRGSILTV
jgi:hypothetical protein